MVTRSQLETVIRTAHEVTGEKDFVIIGSVSILGSFPQKGESLILQTQIKNMAADHLEQCYEDAQRSLKKNRPPSKGEQRLRNRGVSGPEDYPRGREQDHGPELER